jgi:hypothetical protein
VAIALTALAACDRGAPAAGGSSAALPAPTTPQRLQTLSVSALTDAERKFGRAPVPDPSVVYQPEVVMVGGGADAVRALHANGLGCTIDADAARASDLRPGGIAFVTGRCVGRVLAIRRQRGQLELTLGPVEITEIIREGNFELEQPLDLDDTLRYAAPQWPGASRTVEPILQLSYGARSHGWQVMPAGLHHVADAPVTREGPYVDRDQIGSGISYSQGGVDFIGHAQLYVTAPRLKFVLLITGGKVLRAELEFRGAAGFDYAFKAGAAATGFTNASVERDLPLDITIPIGGPVPFSVFIRQSYKLETGFSARNTFLSGYGAYTFTGAFTLGYKPGSWHLDAPINFSQKHNAAAAHNGVSLGFMALMVVHRVRIMVGIGAFGFATGPFVMVNTGFTAARSPDTQGGQFGGPTTRGLAPCNQATLSIAMGAGIGYLIPKSITDIINGILETLNIKYQVKSSGGPLSEMKNKIKWSSWSPDSHVCKLAKEDKKSK